MDHNRDDDTRDLTEIARELTPLLEQDVTVPIPFVLAGDAAAPDGGVPVPPRADHRPAAWIRVTDQVMDMPPDMVGRIVLRVAALYALADGLRDLATAHAEHGPALPFGELAIIDGDPHTRISDHEVTGGGSDVERRAEVDRIAGLLGETPAVDYPDEALLQATYSVEAAFGPVVYRAWTRLDPPAGLVDLVGEVPVEGIDWEGARREYFQGAMATGPVLVTADPGCRACGGSGELLVEFVTSDTVLGPDEIPPYKTKCQCRESTWHGGSAVAVDR